MTNKKDREILAGIVEDGVVDASEHKVLAELAGSSLKKPQKVVKKVPDGYNAAGEVTRWRMIETLEDSE